MKKLLAIFLLSPLFLVSQKKEIAFKTYTIDPNICRGFQTISGSLIFIPDNAFQLEDGLDCREIITVKYREFHSQTDMFYSGLNMIYANNGKFSILESVGMFEIQAWCGTKKLQLKDSKTIQVRMKTRRNRPGLLSFIYDREKNVWSKYESSVFDFSYRNKINNADSVDLWGSGKVSVATATFDVEMEMGGTYKPEQYMANLPEGFFKGMNIKKLGIFNYDGVIKDSLAVSMIPEMFVRNEAKVLEQKVYVTYPNINTLVYYYPHDFKENFVLLKVKGIKLFTEFGDGSVAITKDAEINLIDIEANRGKNIKFYFDRVPMKPKSEQELAKVTGLKTE